MLDIYIKLNFNFTKTEKEECKPIIFRMIDLANLARKEGILALEQEMAHEENFFLKTALGLVTDGTDPELIKQILKAIILADGYSGQQLLSRLIMAEGTLALQQGENPSIIVLKLSAMLGESYISQIKEELSNRNNRVQKYYQFLKNIRELKPLQESAEFESKLLLLDNRSIQVILRDVDYLCILNAIYGCGYAVVQKILNNLSIETQLTFVSDWEDIKTMDIEYIIKCQNKILEKIEYLKGTGEIYILEPTK